MGKAFRTWKVLPHGPVERLTDELWRVQGDVPGMPLKRVMTLVRLGDGRVVIHNAMALEESAMAEIEAWGTPAFLVVPNSYHRLDAPNFHRRYPAISVHCPRGARSKVTEVVPVHGDLDELPTNSILEALHLEGTREREGVLAVRASDGVTLIFNDLIFNMPHVGGFAGFIFRYLTRSSGGPRISRVSRWFLLKDKRACADQLRQLAATPDLRRIIVSHHLPIDDDPAEILRRLAEGL